MKKLLVTGPAADSPARQLGGWSVGWQGLPDPAPADVPVPPVTTLREGLEQGAAARTQVTYEAERSPAGLLAHERCDVPDRAQRAGQQRPALRVRARAELHDVHHVAAPGAGHDPRAPLGLAARDRAQPRLARQ